MPDVFVSYSTHDVQLATFVHQELKRHNIDAFAACASLNAGDHWSPAILGNLKASNWVVVLASKAAASSAYVNQEIGGALISAKNVVPVVWDMSPSELPGWLGRLQAIDLRGKAIDSLQREVSALADRIQSDKTRGLLIFGALVLGLFVLGSGK